MPSGDSIISSVSICPSCSQENPDIARFCLHCGTALATAAHREERRVVSVLFVDIVGFTSRSEQLDPEDVRAFLKPYYEHVRREIEARGGRIEKFVGDAVLGSSARPSRTATTPSARCGRRWRSATRSAR